MAKRRRLSPAPFVSEPGPGPAPARPPIAAVAGEASASAALAEVTETLARAREEGRMVLALPLEAVEEDHLVRDRIAAEAPAGDPEMAALMQSLAARGQQTPVEVTELAPGRYGLISGWRRVTALRRLGAETGEARFDTVLALVRRPEDAGAAYRAMVEENEIRVGLSYYERARVAVMTTRAGVFADLSEALAALFATASRAKRSKIRSFTRLVESLDGSLRYPQAIGERLGLALVAWLEAAPGRRGQLEERLRAEAPQSPEAEQRIIAEAMAQRPSRPPPPRVGPGERCALAEGVELVVAADGSVTLAGPGVDDAFRTKLLKAFRASGV